MLTKGSEARLFSCLFRNLASKLTRNSLLTREYSCGIQERAPSGYDQGVRTRAVEEACVDMTKRGTGHDETIQ